VTFKAWRRVPEAGACSFCLMLATRGAVYRTAQTAGSGNAYHRMCRCDAELEVEFDRRNDIAIAPEDANRRIAYRNQNNRRTYHYDLSRYRVRQPPAVPTQRAVAAAVEPKAKPTWIGELPTTELESLRDAVTKTNPKFSDGAREYMNNCSRCVVAGEVRMRGFDVVAGPALGDYAERIFNEVFDTRGRFFQPAPNGRIGSIPKQIAEDQKRAAALFGSEVDTGPMRIWLKWKWKGHKSGHVTMAEIRDGKITILDPQNGQELPLDALKGRITGARYVRVDDLDLTDEGAIKYLELD
jgi:hypothetical protein